VRTSLLVPITIGAAFGAASTRLAVGDSDLFWHLVVGRDVLRGLIARPDQLSWTVAGHPTSSDQWLGQALWALAYAGGEWRGVVALRAITIALLVAVIAYAALRERPAGPLGAVLAALPAIALSRFVWTERPELFGFVCFAMLIVLLRAARGGSDRALYWIPPLILVWANLHGSFALGVVLVVLVAIEGSVTQRARRRSYTAAAVGSIVATLLTPAGIGTWTAPGFHLLHPPREIQEWSVPDVTTLPGVIFTVALFATLLTALFARARAPREAAVLLPVLFVSLIATRQLPLFVIVAAPYLAAHGRGALAHLASVSGLRLPALATAARPPGRRADAIALVTAAAVLALASWSGANAPQLGEFPSPALGSLRPGPGLLNQYDWGGYLIWATPATPVFIDGRLTPYLPDVLNDYATVVGVHPGWRDVITRRGIRQILVRPADPIAVRARDLGWPVLASSDTFVLIDVP
jgi:hypothetical protein